MDKGCIIGIDVGTTAVKATLFSLRGDVLKQLSTPYPIHRAAGARVEQQPQDWIDAVLGALGVFEKECQPGSVLALGLTSQVNTHVFVDATGDPLARAWVWQDGRAVLSAQQLDVTVTDQQRLDWWGAPLPIDASHVLARMHYMAEHDPAIWEKCRHVMLPKDYCLQRLTGACVTDPLSNIGAVSLDSQFVTPLLDKVPGALERLPALADMCDTAGTVMAGLPFAGVPVSVGTMDAWTGLLGTGTTQPGSGVYLSGTSEILGILSPTVRPTPGVLVMPRCHEMTLHVGPTQSGGASQLWFCQLMGLTPAQMSELAATHDRSKPYPLFLPHLQGERAPLWDAAARGVFIGMDASTDKAAMALAVYDGVACSARWLLDSLQQSAHCTLSSLNAGGGGFQSDLWNQLRSDVLNVELHRSAVKDPGTLGAAGLGAVAAGLYDSVADAFGNLASSAVSYVPDASRAGLHEDRMALYKRTYENTRDISAHWQ